MSNILRVENLTHIYDQNSIFAHDAVKNVTFDAALGEIIGIIGHTGSGKSTLVQHLNGLLSPTEGKIFLEDKDIWENPKEMRKIRSKVGLVFQYPEYQLFEDTVYEDIAFGPKNMGLDGEELDNRIRNICSLLDITEDYFEKSPFDLSGGEKRRIAIAGVMAMNPSVLVLDEPVAGLDPKGRFDVIKMISDYRKTYNATVIIISHNMEEMALLVDKLIVMNNGELDMFGTVEEVFSDYKHLQKIGLNVPIVTQILISIKNKGYNVPTDIFTVEDAVKYLSALNKGGDYRA